MKKTDTRLYIFLLFFLLFVGILVFAPSDLPLYKQRLVHLAESLFASFAFFFLPGRFELLGKGLRATGSTAVFLVVLYCLPEVNEIYRLRVTVLDLNQIPLEDARVWSSIGGEAKKVSGGWEFDIPAAARPLNGSLTVYGSKESAFLSGKKEFKLGNDLNPAISIRLERDTSAFIRGIVIDESGKSVSGARVSVVGYEKESMVTMDTGNFLLAAHAAEGQQVQLRVEKGSYRPETRWHPAGREPAHIILSKN